MENHSAFRCASDLETFSFIRSALFDAVSDQIDGVTRRRKGVWIPFFFLLEIALLVFLMSSIRLCSKLRCSAFDYRVFSAICVKKSHKISYKKGEKITRPENLLSLSAFC